MSPNVQHWTIVLYVAVALSLGYLIYRYHRYSRWEDTDAGRAFMLMKVCLMSLVLYAFAGAIFGPGPWMAPARFFVVGGILIALIYQVRVVVRLQGGFRRRRSVTPRVETHEPMT